jgi:hypothetical protein
VKLGPAETLLAELLAAPTGVATTAVSSAARQTLAARGHRLVEGSGSVRLACATQHFDPRHFATAHRGRFGHVLEVWETLGSTNARAWEAAQEGAPAGAVVFAEAQLRVGGRGDAGIVSARRVVLITHLQSFRRSTAALPIARRGTAESTEAANTRLRS